MLFKNPITSFLYEYGYNGIDNIYEFWIQNREDIIRSYEKRNKRLNIDEELLEFTYKVRWSSYTGLFFRLAIEKLIRTSNNTNFNLSSLTIKQGKSIINLNDFTRLCFKDDDTNNYIDLRGVSILSKKFDDVIIRDVDFSYAALDSCEFRNVKFENCRFINTSFNKCKIVDSSFDQMCILKNNDFCDAFINSDFECNIINPSITYMNFWTVFKIKHDLESQYLDYSKILSESFTNHCEDDETKIYLKKLQSKIVDLYNN